MKQVKLDILRVQRVLEEKKIKLFSNQDFVRTFDASCYRAKYFLESQARRGFLTRLRRGLYAVKHNVPSEEEISNALYRPSYISFEYALAKHNILPEMVYAVTAATTKPTRSFSLGKKSFLYFKIKKEAFAGYSLAEDEGKKYLLADPEKALADYLYFVCLGKKTMNNRLNLNKLNRKKIASYARLYKRPGLLKLVKNL